MEDLAKENYKREAAHGLQQNKQTVSSDQENVHITWAGTETYRYFEKMLVRKFEKHGLVPPFADLDSLNKSKTELGRNQDKDNKQFGILFYVDAGFTSKTCPYCGFYWADSNEENAEKCKFIFENNQLVINIKQGGFSNKIILKESEKSKIFQVIPSSDINRLDSLTIISTKIGLNKTVGQILSYTLGVRKEIDIKCSCCLYNTSKPEENLKIKDFNSELNKVKSADQNAAYNIAKTISKLI